MKTFGYFMLVALVLSGCGATHWVDTKAETAHGITFIYPPGTNARSFKNLWLRSVTKLR